MSYASLAAAPFPSIDTAALRRGVDVAARIASFTVQSTVGAALVWCMLAGPGFMQ